MKLEIFKEAESQKDEPVRLRLIQDGDDIDLVVVDAQGNRAPRGLLLWLDKDRREFRLR